MTTEATTTAGGGGAPGSAAHTRFDLGEVIAGSGAAQVVAASDRRLGREVAITVVPAGATAADGADRLREARIVALLDHPGVVTVHEIAKGPDGKSYVVMRRTSGESLAELIRHAGQGPRAGAIGTPHAAVGVMLHVCDALSRAHAMGVVHRDVRPEHILIGSHGEVVLAGWASALQGGAAAASSPTAPGAEAAAVTAVNGAVAVDGPAADAGAAAPSAGASAPAPVGHPAYMAPEQARGEPADERSDIYAVGATLFHALLLRSPATAIEPAAALAARARGRASAPTATEKERLPTDLLLVLARAMAAEPMLRQQSISELRRDLVACQEGVAAAAVVDPLPVRVVRRLWRHRHALMVLGTLLLAVAAVGGTLAWERHADAERWGEPVVDEHFSDDRWRERWLEFQPGTWKRDGDRLVTCGPGPAFLIDPKRHEVPCAIEYDAEITPGSPPCDLSCMWWQGDNIRANLRHFADWNDGGYWVQLGAQDNNFCSIERHPGGQRVAYVERSLAVGVVHHMRIEFERDAVRAYVDGELWLEHRDLFPASSGYIGLYGYYPGKAFTNVRIWNKGVPERISVLAVGDAAYLRGNWHEAAEEWRQVADSHPGTGLAADAKLRTGLAEWRDGHRDQARADWKGLDGERDGIAAVMRLQGVWDDGDLSGFSSGFAALWQMHPEQHVRMIDLWMNCFTTANGNLHRLAAEPAERSLLALRDQVFPDDRATAWDASILLIRYGRFEDALARAKRPVDRQDALFSLGRNRELVAMPEVMPFYVFFGNLAMGRIDDALKTKQRLPFYLTYALAKAGRFPEATQAARGDPAAHLTAGAGGDRALGEAMAGVLFGDPSSALGVSGWGGELADAALIQLGRTEQAASHPLSGSCWVAQVLLRQEDRPEAEFFGSRRDWQQARWLRALDDGKVPDPVLAEAVAKMPVDHAAWCSWFVPLFAQPLVDGRLSGDDGQAYLVKLAADTDGTLAQRPHFLALLVAGKVSKDDFLAQPIRAEAGAWFQVGTALRAALAGDKPAELAAWQTYRALPMQQRLCGGITVDPTVERFAAWRSAQVSAKP
jgi:hypothetical protein